MKSSTVIGKISSAAKQPCYVSNGETIVPIDKQGNYKLPFVAGKHRWISVIAPDGYKTLPALWSPCDPKSQLPAVTNFSLQRDPRRLKKQFTIIHITDLHMEKTLHKDAGNFRPDSKWLLADIRKIYKAAPEAAFIVATGDLTDLGHPETLNALATCVFAKSPVPVFPVFGGHDANTERLINGLGQYNIEFWNRQRHSHNNR